MKLATDWTKNYHPTYGSTKWKFRVMSKIFAHASRSHFDASLSKLSSSLDKPGEPGDESFRPERGGGPLGGRDKASSGVVSGLQEGQQYQFSVSVSLTVSGQIFNGVPGAPTTAVIRPGGYVCASSM